MTQSTEAAQRSAHVVRDAGVAEQDNRPICLVTITHPSGETRQWFIRTDAGAEGWTLNVDMISTVGQEGEA